MSENEWNCFSGFLLQCNTKCNNGSCPFHMFYKLDNIRKLLLIASVNESEAKQMLRAKPVHYNCYKPKDSLSSFISWDYLTVLE